MNWGSRVRRGARAGKGGAQNAMSIWPFRRSPDRDLAERLLTLATAASRNPEFYGPGRVPDTLEGRFELLTLHAVLVLLRLARAPEQAGATQAFTDRVFSALDAGLREDGVSDNSVPKRMHVLAAAFYGRLSAYSEALAGGEALALALGRNVLGAEAHPFATHLARTMRALAASQGRREVAFLLTREAWSHPSV